MAQNQQVNIAQQNFMARQNLLATGLRMTKQLQPVSSAALGGTMRIPLERMGIMTGITLDITVPVNVTVLGVPSAFGPYTFVNNVTYTDYAGLQRVITSGYQLHALNSIRTGKFVNNPSLSAYLSPNESGVDTNILKMPTAVAQDSMTFSLYIPIAYDPANDLRGAVLSQTIYGDHYVTVTLPQVLVGADPLAFPYTGGTVALGTQNAGQITVQGYQHYIMPQNGVNNLPMIDLSTIYAVEGNFNDSANIVAGQPKYTNWPNNRAIMSAMHTFNQGGVGGTVNGTDLNRIVLLGNSNTNIRELSPRRLRAEMRLMMDGDFPAGFYMLDSRVQPITTQLYGNVQTRFDVATAAAGSYILSQYESTYMSGTPLPGVIQ